MLIPYNTDAPIYHRPFATGAMIVVNCLLGLISLGLSEDVFRLLILQYDHFRPWQWITSHFMHAGPLHLLGNMIVLWSFGLVVEGKLGGPRFLSVYFGIALLSSLLQHPLGYIMGNSGSLGASGIVYGLMAIALVWAPKNNMACVVILHLRLEPFFFEAPILLVAGGLCLMQVAIMVFTSIVFQESVLNISSELLHLIGAAIGGVIGVVLLKMKFVDCEGWDLFSVFRGEEGMQKEVEKTETFERKVEHNTTQSLQDVRSFLQANQPGAAKAAHLEARQFIPNWILPEPEMAALIESLVQRAMYKDAVDMMVEYLQYHRAREATVRVLLAKVCLEQLSQPLQALKVLAKLDMKSLPAEAVREIERLRAIALPLAEDDPFEVVNDW